MQTMYTIKRAAELTGVPETTLRTWERRYGVCVPQRTESGYRLYDQQALSVISTMHRLVSDGWKPAAAAEAIRNGSVPAAPLEAPTDLPELAGQVVSTTAAACTERFLSAAARLDIAGIDESLAQGFALGSFEHVVDSWLFPTLAALGEGWVRGEIDISGEHAASHAVQRRLSAAFDAAGSTSRGPKVVVGLPPGSQHALGALAFATAIRRRGLDVLYLGADLPATAWATAVGTHVARAAVLAVVTLQDRPAARAVAELLTGHPLAPLVCAGGAASASLAAEVQELASSIGAAAAQLDRLVHGEA